MENGNTEQPWLAQPTGYTAFMHMQYRLAQRAAKGKHRQKRIFNNFVLLLLASLFITCGVFALGYENGKATIALSWTSFTWGGVFVAVFNVVAWKLLSETDPFLKWTLAWVALSTLVMVLITRKPFLELWAARQCGFRLDIVTCRLATLPEGCPDNTTACNEAWTATIVLVFLILEVMTISSYVFKAYLYPWLVKNKYLGIHYWRLHCIYEDGSIEYTYRSFNPILFIKALPFTSLHTIRYEGDMDYQGQPHGWGQWVDSNPYGEVMKGFWEHGIPLGPFTSRESGSGSHFHSVRIGFVMCRDESPWSSQLRPKVGALKYGVASVECSVSGKFFAHLPQVSILKGPDLASSNELWFADAVQDLVVVEHSQFKKSVVVSIGEDGLNVTGYKPVEGNGGDNVSMSVTTESNRRFSQFGPHHAEGQADKFLTLDGWEPQCTGDTYECLLFIPGYNTSTSWSLMRFAQLLCLGKFPEYIKPFIFSYPAGKLLSYWLAKEVTEGQLLALYFRETILAMQKAGCRRLHVIGHSMGARAFCSSFSSIKDLLEKPSSLRLASVTLLNPDFERERWIRDVFFEVRALCSVVTMYADRKDEALIWNQRLNKITSGTTPSLGLAVNSMFVPSDYDPMTPDEPSSASLLDCSSGSLKESTRNWSGQSVIGLLPRGHSKKGAAYLDMDVIDTSLIQNNVHGTRHVYFNLNREIIDDIRELIATGKRAKHRSGVEMRDGNEYVCMVAPKYVVNE